MNNTARATILLIIVITIMAPCGGIAATENPHGKLRWDCSACHTAESWSVLRQPMAFSHGETGFPLIGAHQTVKCLNCHTSLTFAHVGIACVDCHTDVHRGQLGVNCQNCHSPRDWEPIEDRLTLHAQRGFPLVGVHTVVDCDACHIRQGRDEYLGAPVDCEGCHLDDYRATTDPNHRQVGFSLDCRLCHSAAADSWRGVVFDHAASTGFALRGAHAALNCSSCHENYQTSPSIECYGCHQTDFERVEDPNHVTGGFTHDCTLCHSENAWSPATFDHNATSFPLTGAHASVNCASCHSNGQYAGTPTDCYSCHQTDFNNTTDPDHQANNFSTDCTHCHTTTAWDPASFDHASTAFPLTGAHVSAGCISCHSTGYSGTPVQCFACHGSDYNNAASVNHVAAGFPTDCQTCHNTSDWQQTTWDHDGQYFPIYSGTHRQEWSLCSDCHVEPTSYATFECILCHAHDKTTTDNHHSEVGDYSYVSTECYRCHPTGRGED